MVRLLAPSTGLLAALLLPASRPRGLVAGQGLESLLGSNEIPPQAQVIDQRRFNVLRNVPPPSVADGNAVCRFLC